MNQNEILGLFSQAAVFGAYKFASYTQAASFLKEAWLVQARVQASEGSVGPDSQSWGNWLWSPISYASSYIYPSTDSNLLSSSSNEPGTIVVWAPTVVAGIIVFGTELLVTWMDKSRFGQDYLKLMQLVRLGGRAFQIGAVGCYVGGTRGIVIGMGAALLGHAAELALTVSSDVNNEEIKEMIGEEQKLLGILSLASFLPLVHKAAPLMSSEAEAALSPAIPTAIILAHMMLHTNYQEMKRNRRKVIVQNMAKISVLGMLLGFMVGFRPRMILVTGAQAGAMWLTYSSMAYHYDW